MSKYSYKQNIGHKIRNGILCLLAISMLNAMGDNAWAQTGSNHK